MKKTVSIIGAVVLVLALIGGAGAFYYTNGPCGTSKVANATKEMRDILTRWVDAENVASQTPRMSLSGQISNLQAIKRDAETLEVPGCMAKTKEELAGAMSASINGYLSFLSQKEQSAIDLYFDSAKQHTANFSAELDTVKKCAPFCKQ